MFSTLVPEIYFNKEVATKFSGNRRLDYSSETPHVDYLKGYTINYGEVKIPPLLFIT